MTKPVITKRSTKGAALTYAELDSNFQNLQDATVSLTAGTGGTQVTADLNGNITLVAGTGVTLTGDNTAKTLTITAETSLETDNLVIGDGSGTVSINTLNDQTLFLRNISTAPTAIQLGTEINAYGTFNIVNGDLSLNNSGVAYITTENSSIPVTIRTNGNSATSSYITLGVGANGNITLYAPGTGSILISGMAKLTPMTTTQRNTYTASNGMIIYNSSTNNLQGYVNGAWVNLGGSVNASDLTGTTLASTITGSSLTSVGTLTNLTVDGAATVVSNSSTDKYINVGTHGQLFDDGNLHLHTNSGSLWINSLDSSTIRLGTQYNSGSGSDVDIGKNLIANSGSVTANATTAFIAGNNAVSGVALQMPSEAALRNLTNGSTNMYFDVSIGGSTQGQFQFRSSNGYTNVLTMSTSAVSFNTDATVTARTASLARTAFNVAIDTELTVNDLRFRISNQSGIFPQVISNTGGSKNLAWTGVGACSGAAVAQVGSTGTIVAHNAWTTLYNSHGMDSAGDTVTVTLQDKAGSAIYRITFMRSDNGSTTGYNIIGERIL